MKFIYMSARLYYILKRKYKKEYIYKGTELVKHIF